MKKKYDIMWLVIMIGYVITFLVLGYVAVCTVLAMAQHGNQPWNMWHLIAEGVK